MKDKEQLTAVRDGLDGEMQAIVVEWKGGDGIDTNKVNQYEKLSLLANYTRWVLDETTSFGLQEELRCLMEKHTAAERDEELEFLVNPEKYIDRMVNSIKKPEEQK